MEDPTTVVIETGMVFTCISAVIECLKGMLDALLYYMPCYASLLVSFRMVEPGFFCVFIFLS